MFDYNAEVQQRLRGNISNILFPILIPLHIGFVLMDWRISQGFSLEPMLARLAILPVCYLTHLGSRKYSDPHRNMIMVWVSAAVFAVSTTYLAFFGGADVNIFYLYSINIVAGLFIFLFTLTTLLNAVTLACFYLPMIVGLALFAPRSFLNSPLIILSIFAAFAYLLLAKNVDILRFKTFQQKINLFFLATTDVLSGLKLRRYFFSRFIQELSLRLRGGQALNLSVALIDIDNFKEVNDLYGHDVGDQMIRHIANIIKTSIRVYDTACRFGGEEFIILFPGTKLEDSKIVADRIRSSLQTMPLYYKGRNIETTVSVGVSSLELPPDKDYSELQKTEDSRYLLIQQMLETIKKADEALYQAKNSGKNRTNYSEPCQDVRPINDEIIEELKGYLVYFEQDVFSLGADEQITYDSSSLGDMKFYSEDYYFRRAVESMYRAYRDPSWHETLVLMKVEAEDQSAIRKEMSKIFRLADTLCCLETDHFGLILFELHESDLSKLFERVKSSLIKSLKNEELVVKMAAASLLYPAGLTPNRQAKKHLTFREFTEKVTEIMGVLKRHRFKPNETIYYYQPSSSKKKK